LKLKPQNEKHLIDMILANVGHLHRIDCPTGGGARVIPGTTTLAQGTLETGGCDPDELAARMKIAPATITKMLQRMEKAGFIQRRTMNRISASAGCT
jgi:transcription initiation factor IIE alpha subunit